MNDSRITRYARLLRRRRWVVFSALPVGLAVLVVPRIVLPTLPHIVSWLLLLVFAVLLVVLLNSDDSCPWCGKSFFSGEKTAHDGFRSLLRTTCANCGMPDAAHGAGQ